MQWMATSRDVTPRAKNPVAIESWGRENGPDIRRLIRLFADQEARVGRARYRLDRHARGTHRDIVDALAAPLGTRPDGGLEEGEVQGLAGHNYELRVGAPGQGDEGSIRRAVARESCSLNRHARHSIRHPGLTDETERTAGQAAAARLLARVRRVEDGNPGARERQLPGSH
jgi:hypothetical protein